MPVLTPAECSALLSLLSNSSRSFAAVASDFRSSFSADDFLRCCCSIALLLEAEELLPLQQRLPLWYILWDTHKDKSLKNSPFIAFLIKAACAQSTPGVERVLLHQLLSAGHLKSVSNQTPEQYAAGAKLSQLASAKDAAALQRQYLGASRVPKAAAGKASNSSSSGSSNTSGLQAWAASAVEASQLARQQQLQQLHTAAEPVHGGSMPAASSPSSSSAGTSRPSWAPSLCAPAALSRAGDPWMFQHLQQLSPVGLQPPWQRPRPPLLAPSPCEWKWLHTELPQVLLWDNTMGEDPRRCQALRELVSKALLGPLLPVQQQAVLSELAADPGLVHQLGLSPQQLPALVENTPVLAYEVLLRLMPSPVMEEYLAVLAHMDMSLHSMEVVNRLTSAVDLPTEFVHLYITNCINSCEDIQDKYLQNRLVRLVCVFLQSLIRNKVINIQDLLHEVQAFCINFSRIREAAALFRLLKQMEAGGVLPVGAMGGRSPGDGMGSPGSMECSSSCSSGAEEAAAAASSSLHVQLELSGRGATPA